MRRLFLAAPILLVASAAAAQTRAIPDRIGAPTRVALEHLVDSARLAGIPRAPLYDKMAEGVLKGADDERILRAVESLVRDLGEARSALGPTADLSLITAGASALHAGIATNELHRLAQLGAESNDQAAFASALITLVDLVAKRVPVNVATSSIQNLIEHRATDRQYAALRTAVEQDILAGRAPEAAVAMRVRAQLGGSPP
jgi:hypothetical protein